jgi:hypothetical protein
MLKRPIFGLNISSSSLLEYKAAMSYLKAPQHKNWTDLLSLTTIYRKTEM